MLFGIIIRCGAVGMYLKIQKTFQTTVAKKLAIFKLCVLRDF